MGTWSGRDRMDSMLRRHPKIDAVYAHNDRIAPGAYQAAKMAGREKEMIFVGIDALPGKGNGLELVLDSVLVPPLSIRPMAIRYCNWLWTFWRRNPIPKKR